MAQRKQEWFAGLRDTIQRNRHMIFYGMVVVSLFGALAGWAMLPDEVTLFGATEGQVATYIPRNNAIFLNLGVSLAGSLLVWRRPRELWYLLVAAIGISMTYLILPLNLGYV